MSMSCFCFISTPSNEVLIGRTHEAYHLGKEVD
jgi:hypothetical protein